MWPPIIVIIIEDDIVYEVDPLRIIGIIDEYGNNFGEANR